MIYEYKCKDCKLEFTEMRKMKDREKPIECYSCGGEGKVIGVKTSDADLQAASAVARKRLLKLKDRFKKGPPFNERLIVKGPFRHAEVTEWMWVELVSWKGNAITGVLLNTPRDLPNYKLGARVSVSLSEVFDYLWTKADGSTEGDETSKIIERRYN